MDLLVFVWQYTRYAVYNPLAILIQYSPSSIALCLLFIKLIKILIGRFNTINYDSVLSIKRTSNQIADATVSIVQMKEKNERKINKGKILSLGRCINY